MYLKQSTATTITLGPFLDDSDGKTAETGLTVGSIDVDIYKNTTKSDITATASGGNNDMVHIANGHYSLELTSGNTDTLGRFMVTANIAGALPVWREFVVLPANVYDSLVAGSDALQVHANEITANLITAAAIADNAIDAGALATSARDAIADAVWDEPALGHQLADPYTTGWLLHEAGSDWTELIADAVWDELLAAHAAAGSAGEALAGAGGGSSPEAIADAVWDELMSGHTTPGTAGTKLTTASEGDLLNGSATAAANLKKVVDGTGLAMPNVTIGAVGSVNATVAANLVAIDGDAVLLDKLAGLLGAGVLGLVTTGTNTATVVSTLLPSTEAGFYKDKSFMAITGGNAGQGGKLVTAYDGTTKRLTIEALTKAMAPGDMFLLAG